MAIRKPRTLQPPPPPVEGGALQPPPPPVEGGATQDAFGTPAQQRELINMVMLRTGMTEEQIQGLGDQGISHEQAKTASGKGAKPSSADEIQRLVSDLTSQMNQGQPAADTQEGDTAYVPPPSPFATAESPPPANPGQAGYAQMLSERMKQMERELNMERENNIVNASNDAFAEGRRSGEREAILGEAHRAAGSPEIAREHAEAQRRRALAQSTLSERLSKLVRS